jgi:hypothetical protein
VVEETRQKSDFRNLSDFLKYCSSRSVFSTDELTKMYSGWKKIFTIKLTYNIALNRRIIRQSLINDVGLPEKSYWGIMQLDAHQLKDIARRGGIDDSLIID